MQTLALPFPFNLGGAFFPLPIKDPSRVCLKPEL